jgi:hypothetical protein
MSREPTIRPEEAERLWPKQQQATKVSNLETKLTEWSQLQPKVKRALYEDYVQNLNMAEHTNSLAVWYYTALPHKLEEKQEQIKQTIDIHAFWRWMQQQQEASQCEQ